MITVIKLGGNIIDDDAALERFLAEVAKVDGPKVLVHGGGKLASALGKQLGIQPQLIDGRRVTDAATLKLVTMAYAGWINKRIVAQLQASGCNALGMCGADGALAPSKKRAPEPVDFGFVGDPQEEQINTTLLLDLLEKNYCPVIAPITLGENGQLLNTNADTLAAVLATALQVHHPVQLIYCFEKNGVLLGDDDDAQLIRELSNETAKQLSGNGTIHSGMLPKLQAAFRAKSKGVERVVIGHALRLNELVTPNSECTVLCTT